MIGYRIVLHNIRTMQLHLASISVLVFVILVSVHAHRSFNRESYAVNDVKITVETDHVARTVDKHFLSYCIDSYVFQPDVRWLKFNFRFDLSLFESFQILSSMSKCPMNFLNTRVI